MSKIDKTASIMSGGWLNVSKSILNASRSPDQVSGWSKVSKTCQNSLNSIFYKNAGPGPA